MLPNRRGSTAEQRTSVGARVAIIDTGPAVEEVESGTPTQDVVALIAGQQVWSERYQKSVGDMYAFQDEVTGRVARALNLELKDALSRRAARGTAGDLDANDLDGPVISSEASGIEMVVIPTDEEAMIAAHCRELLWTGSA